jgi:MoaA/NifB/PqqE/SkfB family radical SAM enzyme
MSFESILRRTWSDNHLFAVLVELTYRCNLDCFFCYNDLGLRGKALSFDQYCDFLGDLAAMQVLNLTLTGGEPLAHPDFLRLGARARELGFVVRIKSNGHWLRGAMARRIRDEIDPFLIEVSLHGASAAVHDRQTRVPGSFDRLIANLRSARRLGLRIKLNSTLTAWNEHETEELLDLALALDLPLQIDPEVTQRDDGSREPLAVTASRAGIQRLFALLAERAAAPAAEEAGGAAGAAGAGGAVGAAGEGGAAGAAGAGGAVGAAGDGGTAGGGSTGSPAAGAAPAGGGGRERLRVLRQADDGLPAAAEKHCGAGSSGIAVDPFGNVYPCVQWRRPVGNLHERSIREIWERSTGLGEVRALTVAAKKMIDGVGEAGGLLAFCPGNAEALTGDPLRLYPAAVRRMELAAEVHPPRHGDRKPLLPILP